MGAPSRIHGLLEQAFYRRKGTYSDGTAILLLADCLDESDLRSVRDFRRLTESQARAALRLIAALDPPRDPAIPLRLIADDRPR